MRISIIGLPGSGKSTMAEMISKKLGIPHIHLDRYWFEAGGELGDTGAKKEKVRSQVRKEVITAIQQDSWVSDGLYAHVQGDIAARADTLIYLDFPLWRLLLNHFIRMWNRKDRHAELSLWQDILFLREIVFRGTKKGTVKKIKAIVDAHSEKVVVLRSHKEIAAYVASLS